MSGEELIVFDCLEYFRQFIAKEDRYNSRRSFVCTKTVIVSSTCYRDTQQVCIIVNCFDNSYQEYQKLCVFSRCFARIQEVDTGIGAHGPVVVFTTSVDTLEWFFMKQAYHVVFCCNFFHDFHCQLVVVNGYVCSIEYRSQLMLCRSNFVMFGFSWDTKFPEFFIKIMHVSRYTRFQGSEVMVFHFLSFWSRSTNQGTSAENQVFSLIIEIFIYQEIFLFRTYGCIDVFDIRIAKKTKDFDCLFI